MRHRKYLKHIIGVINGITIKSKIFIFYAGILLISVSIFVVLTIKTSNQAIVDKATKNAERELSLINKSLLSLTNNSENYVRILSVDIRLQNQLEGIKDYKLDSISYIDVEKILSSVLSRIVQPITHVAAASIISTDGIFFNVGYVDNDSVIPIFNESLRRMIDEYKTPMWTGLIKMKYKDGGSEDVFPVAKTIIGVDTGHILGIAILYLKEKDIASLYLDNMANQNDRFFIVDENKKIVSTQNKHDLYQKFDEIRYLGSYSLEEAAASESLIRDIEGTQTLITVTEFKKLNWKIVSVIPLDEITYENKGITKLIIIFAIACLTFAFAASYLVSYSISKPILKLVHVMKEIKSGNLKLRADLNAKGEIGLLSDGFNSLMDRINSLLEQIYREQKLKRENEFKLLQSQIKPHFLYNTIETIISFIKLGLKDNAMMTAKYLAGFYRISLSKGNDIISIEDEMHLIDNYLSIQQLRYVEYLNYQLEYDETILKYQIPKLTLQPLVENSIYHGLKQKEDKGMLIIKGYVEKDMIYIEVYDDGIGMSKEQIQKVLHRPDNDYKSTDFGVHSVDSRLKLLYGEQYGIHIESNISEYTRVIVKLPAIMIE